MTLREWRKANPKSYVQPFGSRGAFQVLSAPGRATDSRWDLYHLSDYVVSSSASGPSLILVPRVDKGEE